MRRLQQGSPGIPAVGCRPALGAGGTKVLEWQFAQLVATLATPTATARVLPCTHHPIRLWPAGSRCWATPHPPTRLSSTETLWTAAPGACQLQRSPATPAVVQEAMRPLVPRVGTKPGRAGCPPSPCPCSHCHARQGAGDAHALRRLEAGAARVGVPAARQPRERHLHPDVRLQGGAGGQVRAQPLAGEQGSGRGRRGARAQSTAEVAAGRQRRGCSAAAQQLRAAAGRVLQTAVPL